MFPILLLISSAISQCSYTVSGNTYDLSPLQGQYASGKDAKISTYSYHASVCSDLSELCEDIMTGDKLHGAVYQLGGEPGSQQVCWDVLAKWENGQGATAEPLDNSAGHIGGDGLTLHFKNGDNCRGSPRETKLNLVCDSNVETFGELTGEQDSSNSCLFVITVSSRHACKGGGPAPPGPTPSPGPTPPPGPTNPPVPTGPPGSKNADTKSGVSGGWVFIIILICLGFVYVVGFFFYDAYPEKEWKNPQHCVCFSHLNFYKKFLGWVKDGCLISAEKTKECCQMIMSKIRKSDGSDGEGGDEDYD